MLVITRKEDEAIVLYLPDGEKVVIKIIRLKGNQSSIGISAPKVVNILRGEIVKKRSIYLE